MGLHAWSHAFEMRALLYEQAKNKHTGESWYLGDEMFQQLFEETSTNLAAGGPQQVQKEGIEDGVYPSLASRAVTPVSAGYLAATWNNLQDLEHIKPFSSNLLHGHNPAKDVDAQRCEKISNTPTELLYQKLGDDFISYSGDSGKVLALVDLGTPEEKLVEDFLEFVREYKQLLEITSPQKSFGKKDFQKWDEHRILPYLDFLIWHRFHEISATHQQIGVCIFPDDYDISLDDRIRRTVRPLALKLISRSFIAALSGQSDKVDKTASD
jgi:Family of unknown function (DUF6387)